MVMKNLKDSIDDMVESGNWNQGDLFSRLNIHRYITEFNENRIIARTGAMNIAEDIITEDNIKILLRIKALNRMLEDLEIIWDNTRFAIKKQRNKDKMDELIQSITAVRSLMKYVKKSRTTTSTKGRETSSVIDEEVFEKVFDILIKIYREMTTPLNESDLIFYSVEEFSPEDLKKNWSERLTSQG